MAMRTFADLPDRARIWIYGAERALSDQESQALHAHMSRFLAEWTSHEREVAPSWQLVHDQFVVIGVDETEVSLSGCSIDSMVRTLNDFSQTVGLNFSNSGNRVFYRDEYGAVRCVDRLAFRDLAKQDAVNANTIVFNNVVSTVGEYRSGHWEVPMRDSWHIEAFGASLGTGAPVHGLG